MARTFPKGLRESQADKERFHRTALGQLHQRYLAVQAKLDRADEDRLAGQITQEMWSRKSHEWDAELEAIRLETDRHEKASRDYTVTGSRILELAKQAHSLFVQQSSEEQAPLLKTLLSNCTFDRGSLSATYSKPFDMLVEGNISGDWLGVRGDSRTWCLQNAA